MKKLILGDFVLVLFIVVYFLIFPLLGLKDNGLLPVYGTPVLFAFSTALTIPFLPYPIGISPSTKLSLMHSLAIASLAGWSGSLFAATLRVTGEIGALANAWPITLVLFTAALLFMVVALVQGIKTARSNNLKIPVVLGSIICTWTIIAGTLTFSPQK